MSKTGDNCTQGLATLWESWGNTGNHGNRWQRPIPILPILGAQHPVLTPWPPVKKDGKPFHSPSVGVTHWLETVCACQQCGDLSDILVRICWRRNGKIPPQNSAWKIPWQWKPVSYKSIVCGVRTITIDFYWLYLLCNGKQSTVQLCHMPFKRNSGCSFYLVWMRRWCCPIMDE